MINCDEKKTYQCCVSDGVPGSGSGSRRVKMTRQKWKKVNKFHFLKCWLFFLRAEGFSCSGSPLRRPMDSKLELDQKKIIFFSYNYFSIFGHGNPGSSGSVFT
jgi:hypothetical protein